MAILVLALQVQHVFHALFQTVFFVQLIILAQLVQMAFKALLMVELASTVLSLDVLHVHQIMSVPNAALGSQYGTIIQPKLVSHVHILAQLVNQEHRYALHAPAHSQPLLYQMEHALCVLFLTVSIAQVLTQVFVLVVQLPIYYLQITVVNYCVLPTCVQVARLQHAIAVFLDIMQAEMAASNVPMLLHA